MDLLIDGGSLQTASRDRGIGRYSSCLLAALRRVRPGWRMRVIEHGELPSIPVDRVAGLSVIRFTAPLPYDLAATQNFAVNDAYFADWLLAAAPDHIFFTSVFEKFGVIPRFTGPRPPMSAIMYDLIPVLFPQEYGVLRGWFSGWYARRFRDMCGMDRLFAISAATAADTRRLIGPSCPPVANIRGAVDDKFAPMPSERLPEAAAAVHAKYGLRAPFLLYVGGQDYRKNLTGAVAGFAALPARVRRNYQLVIACDLHPLIRDELNTKVEQLGLSGQVLCTGFVTDSELTVLYQTCRLFLFPSLYEGLGLPVLEALMCGAPVACSNCSSMPEFAGTLAKLFDPHRPESMTAAITECLAEPREQGRVERERFARSLTWDDTAETVAAGIEEGRRAPRKRGRVAWVSATPPDFRPGRLDSADLLAELGRTWDVELVLPPSVRSPTLAHRHLLLAPHEFSTRAEAEPFDLCVLNVGSEDVDSILWQAAVRSPTLVMLNPPGPTGYCVASLRPLLVAAGTVVVGTPEMRAWVKTFTRTPVVLLPRLSGDAGGASSAAAWLAAAIRDTAARVGQDRRWADAAAETLSALPVPPPADLIQGWARLRLQTMPVSAQLPVPAAA